MLDGQGRILAALQLSRLLFFNVDDSTSLCSFCCKARAGSMRLARRAGSRQAVHVVAVSRIAMSIKGRDHEAMPYRFILPKAPGLSWKRIAPVPDRFLGWTGRSRQGSSPK